MQEASDSVVLLNMERVDSGLWVFVGTFILILGTGGNILVLVVVCCRPETKHRTNSFHLTCLATVDLSVLYIGMLRYLIIHLIDFDIREYSIAACKIHLYLTYVSTELSAWVLIQLTLERLAAVFLVHRVHLVFTLTRARIALSITSVAILLINTPYLLTFTLMSANNSTVCDIDKQWDTLSDIFDWVHLAISSAVPFTIMAFANTAIICRLYRERRRANPRKSSGRSGDPTCLLLTVTSTFIFTTAPCAIYIGLVNNRELFETVRSPEELSRLHVMGTSFALLSYTNNAINFLSYCLMGSSFRTDLIKIIKKKRIHPAVTQETGSAARKHEHSA
ncbi:hypothetical protein CAPTEDRAFT_205371 [Capitella teleta]|uniref:G-protein coupled receptors family 1 profile domain-containing protein n=1 Tax=Capitella teleta TaxID=283909 RepID=R7TMK9_CAPTE|nr:hypothetical protein CAPTEDRAFT_205371 [Capitella teleta]|eukprot:ELT94869.1 hypothetical protein CAPTEDRAFT_205371 [Capitella teleta]